MALKFEYDKETRTAIVCGVEDKFCEQIVIPSTVEYYRKKYDVVAIKARAFKGCIKLKSVTISDSVTKIGSSAFYGCSNLKEFKGKFAADNGRCLIEDGVLIAYASASGEVYAIPNGVTKIGWSAFSGCRSLTSVTIPNSVTEIRDNAFYNCKSLTSITIPDSVTKIESTTFCDCTSLTSVTIPNSVTMIGESAFTGCSSLTSVTIPDSVTSIGVAAFYNCRSLTSITISNSVTVIEGPAFTDCSSLREFKGKFAADNGRCLIKDGALIAYASASGTTYAIPDGVTEIEGSAFSGCSSLTSVTIPNSVTEIRDNAFYNCISLTSITIPDSVTEIGGLAFHGCRNLKEFKGKFAADNGRCLIKDDALIVYASASGEVYAIPNGVTKIGEYAFYDCHSLTSVTIPNSVTKIGKFAFGWCSSLKKVEICNEQGSVKIDSGAFGSDVKVTYLGKDAQPKPKQEIKEQPAPEVATPAPTIDLDKLIDAATAEKQREAQPKKKGFFARLFGKK